jgi:hypothetical protein
MKRITIITLPILLIITACGGAGGSQTQTLDIPYPGTDVVTVNLSTTSGQIGISAGDSAGVNGTLTTNVGDWKATSSSDASSISVAQGTASADVIPNAVNTWDIQLGKGKTLILNDTNTAANTTLNLGGLSLSALNVTASSGDTTVRFAAANPISGQATLQSNNGDFDLAGLANSNLSSLALTTTGGSMQLGFDGAALTQNMNVSLETQAGDILLKIPQSMAAQVTYNSSSGTVLESDPQYKKTNAITYTVGNYDASDGSRLTIEIRSVVGDLRLAGA